jgi:hypothetical protein
MAAFFSITSTWYPAFARYAAALKPAKPEPITAKLVLLFKIS